MKEKGGLHEPMSAIETSVLDSHRAYQSLMEELEAIDWYSQRIEATANGELAAVLHHNREEEKEHAAMILEWIRRGDSAWNRILRAYLFTSGPIASAEGRQQDYSVTDVDEPNLGIGDLRRHL